MLADIIVGFEDANVCASCRIKPIVHCGPIAGIGLVYYLNPAVLLFVLVQNLERSIG